MREQVEIFPSTWFVVVAICFITLFGILIFDIQKPNDQLDTLIKIEQQILMYSQK